jgi:hypothetical protein
MKWGNSSGGPDGGMGAPGHGTAGGKDDGETEPYLWDRWYWLTMLVVVVGLEWAVRRRFGYV